MKVYVLLFSQDISGTKGSIDEFVKISSDKDELIKLMDLENKFIDSNWDDEDEEWGGVNMSSKPYYYIMETEI
jgi:hypothetical protein